MTRNILMAINFGAGDNLLAGYQVRTVAGTFAHKSKRSLLKIWHFHLSPLSSARGRRLLKTRVGNPPDAVASRARITRWRLKMVESLIAMLLFLNGFVEILDPAEFIFELYILF